MQASRSVVDDQFKNRRAPARETLHTLRDDASARERRFAFLQLGDGAKLTAVFVASRPVKQQVDDGAELESLELRRAFRTNAAQARHWHGERVRWYWRNRHGEFIRVKAESKKAKAASKTWHGKDAEGIISVPRFLHFALCTSLSGIHLVVMANEEEAPIDRLWRGYSSVFKEFDDLMLARWMAQTLGQLEGRAWRFSHPLMGAYRLAAQVAHERQIWLKRLASPPPAYAAAPCCRAPLLPLLSRDLLESGLVCVHCNGTAVPLDEIGDSMEELKKWADAYAPLHAVAHWDDRQRKRAPNYDRALDDAAVAGEQLLARLGGELAPRLLASWPAVVWEDQDECLDVRPEDIPC